jgi:hypothetical protein
MWNLKNLVKGCFGVVLLQVVENAAKINLQKCRKHLLRRAILGI